MTVNNYIFDFDGTLIDSSEDILSSIDKACNLEGIRLKDLKKITIGKPINQMLKAVIRNSEMINRVEARFRDIYDNLDYSGTTPYSGVEKLLKKLKEQNKRLFLLTNKPNTATVKILNRLKWQNFFTDIFTVDKFIPAKNKSEMLSILIKQHNLTANECIYLGDSIEDMEAAKVNNITAIGAMWGYEKNKNSLAAQADFTLETLDVDNIEELIEQLTAYFMRAAAF